MYDPKVNNFKLIMLMITMETLLWPLNLFFEMIAVEKI